MPAGETGTAEPALGALPDLDELPMLGAAECEDLAARIRAFLIANVTRTGGHLGANLSTVELTLALHRAFRSPDTMIIWDTGHQCYTHKILTGRDAGFAGLRTRDGMSGFPNRAESRHDLVENSHASVGPAWAHGVALATGRTAVTVLGDGALTGGVAYEALNAIGFRGSPVVVVLNDNGRSYADTPSRLTYGEPLTGRTAPGSSPEAFFRALGLDYHGPVDGHDIRALDDALGNAVRGPLPCVVHVRTQKGYGWPAALADDAKRLHDVGPNHAAPNHPGPGLPTAPARPDTSWSATVGDLLCESAATDPRVCAITAAMPGTLGLDRFRARFPDRYHDLGIAEQACVAMAAGLASHGMRPFFSVVTTFLTRGIDQVLNDVALHRLPVVFLLDRAGVTGPDGASHHGVFDVGLLRNVPGLEIYSPATEADVRELFAGLLRRDHGPVVVRYPKGRPADAALTRTGLIRPGREACLVAHGSTVRPALAAAEELAGDGIDCGVWRLLRIDRPDEDLVRFAMRHPLLVPMEELSEPGGIAGPLAAALVRRPSYHGRVVPLTLPPVFLPHGSRDELLADFGLTSSGAARFVRRVLGRV